MFTKFPHYTSIKENAILNCSRQKIIKCVSIFSCCLEMVVLCCGITEFQTWLLSWSCDQRQPCVTCSKLKIKFHQNMTSKLLVESEKLARMDIS